MSLHNFFETIGFSSYKAGNGEVLVSAVGGLVGILEIFLQ